MGNKETLEMNFLVTLAGIREGPGTGLINYLQQHFLTRCTLPWMPSANILNVRLKSFFQPYCVGLMYSSNRITAYCCKYLKLHRLTHCTLKVHVPVTELHINYLLGWIKHVKQHDALRRKRDCNRRSHSLLYTNCWCWNTRHRQTCKQRCTCTMWAE